MDTGNTEARPLGWDDAWRDLLLGSRCVACARPGRLLCRGCEAGLPCRGVVAWPTPTPSGLACPVAAGTYDGALRALVNGHKEHRMFALVRPLGRLLAVAVATLDGEQGPRDDLVLVPVPSRRRVVRARGHDPLLRVARAAAGELRASGRAVRVRQALAPVGPVRDQATLSAVERAANLQGTLEARPGRSGGRPAPGVRVVVVDDVLTTGSTVREAQRALESVRWPVSGIAVVAATRRRLGPLS